ncbi:RNA 2',3'-cyclic phosphodiesterase [Corynebacterium halotolerans]|uniref:RNA 2',3'-cyclic phosphodiesterase n=1 Tax=Corynebacterium halotolerans TaxID=225326 RepID=UPI003CF72356
MRLFASMSPSEEAREHLVRALRPIRRDLGADLRWTDPDQWHLTLAFYGEQPEGAVDELLAHLRVAAAGTPALRLALKGAGSFNRKNLWVGVGGDTPALKRLMADCLLDPTERQRQRAHLTVARNRVRNRDWDPFLADVVRALSVYEGPDFMADQIHLVQSTLGAGRSGGALHEVIGSVPLENRDLPLTR